MLMMTAAMTTTAAAAMMMTAATITTTTTAAAAVSDRPWLRRARPLLGTLVEIGVRGGRDSAGGAVEQRALSRAFERITAVQRCLSRFEAASDIGRFNTLRDGEAITVQVDTQTVLGAARQLAIESGGCFDVNLGGGGCFDVNLGSSGCFDVNLGSSGADAWYLVGDRLGKRAEGVRLDLGGIAKGYAVDCAVRQLQEDGVASGWVNAGGDLRAFGDAEVPVQLRDETSGGVRPFALLADGAFATSGHGLAASSAAAHVSVAAPCCLWADALTKVVAATGDAAHPVLARYDARAWVHAVRTSR